MDRSLSRAFTLVEILIVVVILGILSSIVVPQFTNATRDADAGNIQAQLDTVNNQIELFRCRNNVYPGTATPDTLVGTDWSDMINGGYLKTAPKNPYNGSSAVGQYPGSNPATDGWHWGPNANNIYILGATNFDENTALITPGVE
jgi:general secretion pathway protein G